MRILYKRTACVTGVLAAFAFTVRYASAQATPSALAQSQDQYLNTHEGVEYVGDESCRQCHSSVYTQFKRTGMGRSTSVPSAEDLKQLAKPVKLVDKKSHTTYSVYARDGKMLHEESETDAAGHPIFSETHEVAYTVGAGDVGKSYLVAEGDALFVSPISYYTRVGGWDLSPGYDQGTFHGFTRRVVDLCVDCHTGSPQLVAGSHNRFQMPPFRFLTVGCERCHGPGAVHVRQRTQEAATGEVSDGMAKDLSIVNPQKLSSGLRDDVCAQCHLAGDARVLQPGRNYIDFRPGTPLGDVVAIFSVPQDIKGNHFVALDQFSEMKLSRCWNQSQGKLGCISCHDPHVQLHGEEAVAAFRGRCLACHSGSTATCRAPQAQRQSTQPPDNCLQCHMPKQPTENIGHSSVTDHRILRSQSEIAEALRKPSSGTLDLIEETKASTPSTAKTDLRTAALGYAQVSHLYPEFGEKGLSLLQQASMAFPSDAEVQAAYGLVLGVARPREGALAAQALQKAIDLGSQSIEVRMQLARSLMREGKVTPAMELYREAIRIDPYHVPAYVELARIDLLLKDKKGAVELFDRALKSDPGNDSLREERRLASTSP